MIASALLFMPLFTELPSRGVLRSLYAGSWIIGTQTPRFQLRASTTPRRLVQHL
jgi:hypothetical protein